MYGTQDGGFFGKTGDLDVSHKVITHLKPPPEIDYPNRWVEERNLRALH